MAATTGQRTIRLLLFCLLLSAVGVMPACAEYYFYGVACNELLDSNDTLWNALCNFPQYDASNAVLRDDWLGYDLDRNDGRDTIYDDILWYGSNLQDGDVLVFRYSGHGGNSLLEDIPANPGNDEGDAWPYNNDPIHRDSDHLTWDPPYTIIDPPYKNDEYFGYFFDGWGIDDIMTDDRLGDVLDGFDAGVEIVIISDACHSGGWVGGADDMDNSAAATNDGLYAMLAAPEHGFGIGLMGEGETYYQGLLNEALCNSLDPYNNMTFPEWYAAALDWGDQQTAYTQRDWWASPDYIEYWPDEDWVPSYYETLAFADSTPRGSHWGWENYYLQLRPTEFNSLDEYHDRYANPEPATVVLLVLGMAALAIKRRVTQA